MVDTLGSTAVLLESSALNDILVPLNCEKRLAVLEDLDILDAPVERNFQLLTQLANSLLNTPVSLITMVTDERQFFVSSQGLSEPWRSQRQTPLSHSFCQHVVNRNEPLVVGDARNHPLVCNNLAIRDLNVAAYLGIPLVHDDQVLGSFCVISDRPHEWTTSELSALEKLAELAASELGIRKEANRKQGELENRLRQAQKMEAIGQLTGGVAHDFNNVLWGIQIYTDLLKREFANPEVANSHIEQIRKAVDSAKTIVQQLLNLSRPEVDTKTRLSLQQTIMNSLPLLRTTLSPLVTISCEATDDAGMIFADATQINQILLNLCSNAEHAMRDTGGQINITVDATELDLETAEEFDLEAGPYVRLKVSDTGYGIQPEFLNRIHDPYFTTKPVGEGTGLGLWTVFGIVQSHEGQIEVDSSPEQGTTFTILFPRCQRIAGEIATNASPALPQETIDGRIMIVDDDVTISTGLKQLLSLEGYDVESFVDSTKALEHFLHDPTAFDLIVTDRAMPGINGDELIKQIKSANPSVAVIACSGYVADIVAGKVESIGADAYCIKPLDLDELGRTIRSLLKER